MKVVVFVYRFLKDANVDLWHDGECTPKQYKTGDILRVLGYPDDEDKTTAGAYGYPGSKGTFYMGGGPDGSYLHATLENGDILDGLLSSTIEEVDSQPAL